MIFLLRICGWRLSVLLVIKPGGFAEVGVAKRGKRDTYRRMQHSLPYGWTQILCIGLAILCNISVPVCTHSFHNFKFCRKCIWTYSFLVEMSWMTGECMRTENYPAPHFHCSLFSSFVVFSDPAFFFWPSQQSSWFDNTNKSCWLIIQTTFHINHDKDLFGLIHLICIHEAQGNENWFQFR